VLVARAPAPRALTTRRASACLLSLRLLAAAVSNATWQGDLLVGSAAVKLVGPGIRCIGAASCAACCVHGAAAIAKSCGDWAFSSVPRPR